MTALRLNHSGRYLLSGAFRVINIRVLNFCSSSKETNVKTIRLQQKIKESTKCQDVLFTRGQFLVFDVQRDLVLINTDRTSNKIDTLMWRTFSDLTSAGFDVKENAVFLSINSKEECHFAITFPSSKERLSELEKMFQGNFIPLRKSLFTLSKMDSKLVAQGHSLLRWNQQFNFCSSCGGRLEVKSVGAQKVCSSCNEVHYPHLSPVGIVLVTDKDHSRALLVRQPRSPPGMYSCIAGFIEVGETIEENIRREVAEEVGLSVCEMEYLGSQHWSLPASRLMIACIATVHEGELDLDRSELEAGRWFSPSEVRDALARVTLKSANILKEPDEVWVSPRGAIAHDLIKYWLTTYHQQ